MRIELYHACVWIQGKTRWPMTKTSSPLYHACVWIQGKTSVNTSLPSYLLYHACVWIQGKTREGRDGKHSHCTMPVFGFKAKLCRLGRLLKNIVPCLCLDSRQNSKAAVSAAPSIVPCLCLDSRQNGHV